MKRVMDNEFKSEHQVTIGVEFGSFGIRADGKVIKLQIWDTVRIKIFLQTFLLGRARVLQVGDKDLLPGRPLRVFDL